MALVVEPQGKLAGQVDKARLQGTEKVSHSEKKKEGERALEKRFIGSKARTKPKKKKRRTERGQREWNSVGREVD